MPTKKRTDKFADDLRPEYDLKKLTGRVRGKYYKRATAGTNLVLIEPDIARAFPDSQAVNDALRVLVDVATAKARLPNSNRNKRPNKQQQLASRVKRARRS